MRVLVFGRDGQVASALARLRPDAICLDRAACDLSRPGGIPDLIARHAPGAVINAAAYTAVDRAEDEEALATTINGTAPGLMAAACVRLDIPFVHISTDYVFDGSGDRAWQPDDTPAPLGAYGRSKLAGETAIRAAGGRGGILRTSAVFSATGANFVRTMLRLGAERDTLNVVADQITGPTPAAAIAEACLRMAQVLSADPQTAGTYHLCGTPAVSWAEFARAIFAVSGQAVAVRDIPSRDYPTPARRPANSRLDCRTLTATFGIDPPPWQPALDAVVTQLMQEART